MNPTQQAQYDSLEKIKGTLTQMSGTLGSMSTAEKAKFDNSDAAKGVQNVLGSTSQYFGTLKPQNGTLTSTQARQAVNAAGKNITQPGTNDAFAQLQQSNQKLQADFAREKATREGLEADVSLADKRLQQEQAGAAGVTPPGGAAAGTPTGTEGAAGTSATPGNLEAMAGADGNVDPVVQAITDAFNERTAIVNQRLDALNSFVDAEDDDSKKMIENIRNTAAGAAQRVQKENERLAQAARVAGIVSGRGMYSPEEHEGIISEVIQDGYARIAEIESTRDMAILEAKKAQREFRYKAFVEASDMVGALSDMKRQTIVDMSTRIAEVERSEREKMKFDQEQADRNALILAPELVGATPEQIMQAALANNVDPGLLKRAIDDYAFQADDRALGLDVKREQIKSEQFNRQLAGIREARLSAEAAGKKAPEMKAMSEAEQNQFFISNGWVPPYGMSSAEALKVEEAFRNEPASVKLNRARDIMFGFNPDVVDSAIADVRALAESDEKVQDTLDAMRKELGMTGFFGRGKGDVLESERFKGYVAEAQAQAAAAAAEGNRMTTREIVDLAAKMALQDAGLKKEETEQRQTNFDEQNEPFRTAQSTPAVIMK